MFDGLGGLGRVHGRARLVLLLACALGGCGAPPRAGALRTAPAIVAKRPTAATQDAATRGSGRSWAERVFEGSLLDWTATTSGRDGDSFAPGFVPLPEGSAAGARRSTVAVFGEGRKCSGVIVGERHVLTGKGCVPDGRAEGRYVGFGDDPKGAVVREIASIRFSPGDAGVALLVLRGELPPAHSPVRLIDAETPLAGGETATVSGYLSASKERQDSLGRLVQNGGRKLEAPASPAGSHVLSAAGGKDPCGGHPGGPVFVEDDNGLLLVGLDVAGTTAPCARTAKVADLRPLLGWLHEGGVAKEQPPAPAFEEEGPSTCSLNSDRSFFACLGPEAVAGEPLRACIRGYFAGLRSCDAPKSPGAADAGKSERDGQAAAKPEGAPSGPQAGSMMPPTAPTTPGATATPKPSTPAPTPGMPQGTPMPAPTATPAPMPSPAPTMAPATERELMARQVFDRVNQERSMRGIKALVWDARATKAAQAHADDMAARGYFDHESPEGGDISDRMSMAGYTGFRVGENIALGQTSAREVMDGWMASTGHRINILSSGYSDFGLGIAKGKDGRIVWVQTFGQR